MPEELIDVAALRRRVDDNLARMSRRVKIIDDAVKTGRVVSGSDLDVLNKSLPTTTADLEIMALMLEAKAGSRSRTERSHTNSNDRYQPFVIGTEEQLIKIGQIISEKQERKEPFRFDFIYDESGSHATPIEIISDGVETNIFHFDAADSPITRTIFPSSIREKSVYHIYRKQKVNIQTGGQECGVFAIQDLDILNNMSIPEKKRIGNNDELDPRFFKMTQSLSSLPESHRNKIITKPTKPAKNLGEHLEQGTIKIIDTKTGEEKLQHRFFDKKYYKYLQKAKEILDNKNDAEIAAIIARRSNYSEEFNAYITPDYKPLNEQSRQEAINKITDSSNGLEIGDVIRSFSPEDRMNLEINDLLNSKISEIANNDSNNNNKGAEINHIITAFPEDVRSIFRDVAISSAKKLPIDDAVKIMESFSVNDRSFFIPTMQSLFEKESSLKNVKEIISCFNEKDRNQLLVPIKNLLSTISKPEGLRGIIQWDSSLVEDVQVPLSKAITSTDSKMSSVTIFSMIKASPENQRYHFIDNIKLYVGGIDDLDVKADELVFLANTLAPGAKRAFHDDVENLVRGGVSNKIVKRLKNSFKEFDFVKLEVDEKRESLSKSETKAITPTPPPHVVTPAKPPSPPGFSR